MEDAIFGCEKNVNVSFVFGTRQSSVVIGGESPAGGLRSRGVAWLQYDDPRDQNP